VVKENKKLTATIDKGTPHGDKQVIHGEADHLPEMEAGDVIIVVMEKPHKLFKRKGADLVFEKTISLHQALTGVDFVLKHLDGRQIRVKNQPGEVIKPHSMKTCIGFGMPFHKKIYENGNLFVKFNVNFPDQVPVNQLDSIKQLLSQSPDQKPSSDGNEAVEEEQFLQNL
jgi:DnaJ family protein A protein 2